MKGLNWHNYHLVNKKGFIGNVGNLRRLLTNFFQNFFYFFFFRNVAKDLLLIINTNIQEGWYALVVMPLRE